jgi:chaperone required for assembly of F1-ATPase
MTTQYKTREQILEQAKQEIAAREEWYESTGKYIDLAILAVVGSVLISFLVALGSLNS